MVAGSCAMHSFQRLQRALNAQASWAEVRSLGGIPLCFSTARLSIALHESTVFSIITPISSGIKKWPFCIFSSQAHEAINENYEPVRFALASTLSSPPGSQSLSQD